MLQVVYGGVERIVEPYELVFKRRQDGITREYFYVWDRVGGSSGPGVKSLWPERVQRLHLDDETYEPKFPVALTKDGTSEPGAFARPFASGPRFASARSARGRSSAYDYPYRVQCPYCLKVFRRKTPSTRLNPHKDGYGNRCYGRLGAVV